MVWEASIWVKKGWNKFSLRADVFPSSQQTKQSGSQTPTQLGLLLKSCASLRNTHTHTGSVFMWELCPVLQLNYVQLTWIISPPRLSYSTPSPAACPRAKWWTSNRACSCMWIQLSVSPQNSNQNKSVSVCMLSLWSLSVWTGWSHTRACVCLTPYRLHLFGDGGELLNFGPQFIPLSVHHFLQPQHHLPLLPLDAVCTQTHTHTKMGWISAIFLKKSEQKYFPRGKIITKFLL